MTTKATERKTLGIGDKRGDLTVIDIKAFHKTFKTGLQRKLKDVYVECVCGRKKWIRYEHVNNARVKSCGCYNYLPRCRDDKLRTCKYVRNYLNASSKKRELTMSLTLEDIEQLIFKNCHYCGKSPSNGGKIASGCRPYGKPLLLTNGIDRIDSSIGYILGNVVTCCSICNTMKFDLTLTEFKDHVRLLYKHFGGVVP